MEPISWPELGQTSRARVLRALAEVHGTRITGPDIRRRVDHGDYRKRICELIAEAGIPVDRPGDHGGKWQEGYELLEPPASAVAKYLKTWPRMRRKALGGGNGRLDGGSENPALESSVRPIEEVVSASIAGKRLQACRSAKKEALERQGSCLN
jgi:hypothetical protein